jgi:TadE-like protein
MPLFPREPRAANPTERRRRSRGQSLVEFALVLPVLFFMLMVGLDFGRVFFGWVALNNTARIAANYAAINPTAWSSGNAAQQSQYAKLISDDFTALNCAQPGSLPTPTFPSGTALGGSAEVHLTCAFSLITPVLGDVFKGGLSLGASAIFPIRAGVVAGIATGAGDTPVGRVPAVLEKR